MRVVLLWLVLVPAAVLIALFAISNRGPTIVDFDPFPYVVQTQLFVVILGAVFVGLVIGTAAAWLGQGRWRRQARQLHRRVRHLEGEIDGLRARTATTSARPNDDGADRHTQAG